MSYGVLIVDDQGLPIPQAVDIDAQTLVPLWAKNQALRVINVNDPENGVTKTQLVGADGTPVSATQAGLAVFLADSTVNPMQHTGTKWVEAGQAKNIIAIALSSYQSLETPSIDIWNGGARNGLLAVKITSGNTHITKIALQLKIGTEYVPYKELTVDCTVGTTVIPFGLDAAEDFKCVIPSEFRIVCKPADSNALTYQVGLQLI